MAIPLGRQGTIIPVNVSTVSKTITLPPVSENPGRILIIKDTWGNASVNRIGISTIGSDRIEGPNTSNLFLSTSYGSWYLTNDEVNRWFFIDIYTNTAPILSNVFASGFAISLTDFSNFHVANSSNIYVSNVNPRYFYTFDGTALNSINDGGGDMYDGGNFLSYGYLNSAGTLIQSNTSINYGTISNTLVAGSNQGFFVSQKNIWPQVCFAYAQTGRINWRVNGDVGTDGGGTNGNSNGTYTCPNNRFGNWWANYNGGTGDPSICEVWFTILFSNVPNSLINSCNDARNLSSPPPNAMNQSFTVGGSNFCFCLTLLSKASGVFVTSTEITNYLTQYVQNATITF